MDDPEVAEGGLSRLDRLVISDWQAKLYGAWQSLLGQGDDAAVVIVYSVGLIKPSEFRAIRGVRTMEFRWALIACVGVLLFGTLKGIVVAIIVSMIGLASQAAAPRVSVIGRKRGADVLRPLSSEHPSARQSICVLLQRG